MLTGFFWKESADRKDKRLEYRCLKCSVHYSLGDVETKVFCCQKWKPVPVKSAGFFGWFEADIPTEQPVRAREIITLRHPCIGDEDED
jgi:hypothetical protein